MKRIILLTIIFYGIGSYLCMNKNVNNLFLKSIESKYKDERMEKIEEEEEDNKIESESDSESDLEDLESIEDLEKLGDDTPIKNFKTIDILESLIDEIKNNEYMDVYIDHQNNLLTDILNDIKYANTLNKDIKLKEEKQKEMKRLFLNWKSFKNNKYGSYENLSEIKDSK